MFQILTNKKYRVLRVGYLVVTRGYACRKYSSDTKTAFAKWLITAKTLGKALYAIFVWYGNCKGCPFYYAPLNYFCAYKLTFSTRKIIKWPIKSDFTHFFRNMSKPYYGLIRLYTHQGKWQNMFKTRKSCCYDDFSTHGRRTSRIQHLFNNFPFGHWPPKLVEKSLKNERFLP